METDFSYIDENYKKIAYNVQEAFAKYRNSNEHIDIRIQMFILLDIYRQIR